MNALPSTIHPRRPATFRAAVAVLGVSLAAALAGGASSARTAAPEPVRWPEPVTSDAVALTQLPAEARRVRALIDRGGPFAYDRDGSVFFNRERRLPRRERGYWREYTVPTPGATDRGARRIVCGGAPPSPPEVCYYTADHYASFRRIVQ